MKEQENKVITSLALGLSQTCAWDVGGLLHAIRSLDVWAFFKSKFKMPINVSRQFPKA